MTERLFELFLNCRSVSTDTRNIKDGDIFFALKGESFNGNKFAAQAIENGAAWAVIDEEEYHSSDKTILVDDVLDSLQKLAIAYRQSLKIPFIGITGTNGKTTTKELISTVLASTLKVHFTLGNFNNHIGVPLTILAIPEDAEIAVIEMGANHPGEIADLCRISQPDYGVITNIGKAHLEGFGGYEGVIKTKNELYEYIQQSCGALFVNNHDELLMKLSTDIDRNLYPIKGVVDASVSANNPQLTLDVVLSGNKHVLKTNLVGEYNLYNILVAMAVGLHFGVEEENIVKSLSQYTPVNNRSQLMKTEKNMLILDAYNANPSSMTQAIRNFANMNLPDKMLILGDMLELGDVSEEEHIAIVDLCLSNKLSQLFLVGSQFQKVDHPASVISFEKVDDLREYILKNEISNHNILIKGSRGIRLEKLIEVL
jgi:UDP-N-acetylmuramoyl-tripeptide--D-alanyl-D-alanine ligase